MRRWAVVVAILAGAGLLDSLYLTLEHYDQQVPLYCTGGVFNCGAVLQSSASTIGGVPVALGGLLWFGAMLVLAAFGRRVPRLRPVVLVWSVAGALAVIYLVYTELFVVGALCLWCSVAHLLALTLFAWNLFHWWDLKLNS